MVPEACVTIPQRVGIRGMEVYFPKLYVDQNDLELYDNIEKGKYTRGLGQNEMSFCADHEDITSICLTVVSKLMNRYVLSPQNIGFLCVGTETLTDKSKSVKTSLMRLFEGNGDIEGVDVKNACFGGTQALFHAIDWIYANWQIEQRFAIVVMADIAVYDVGPARCTGGAGAFAALIGPDAIVSFDRGLRAMHIIDAYDFYKPNQPVVSEYPIVDGVTSLQSYQTCLGETYELYCKKAQRLEKEVSVSKFDAVFFHCPFTRLVQKAVGLLAFMDFKHGMMEYLSETEKARASSFSNIPHEKNYTSRDFADMTYEISKEFWSKKTEPYLLFNRRIGNMYTASLYLQLVAFFHCSKAEKLHGQRLLFFSYGSGAAAAMFSAEISMKEKDSIYQYTLMKHCSDTAATLLEKRLRVNPERYYEIMTLRERLTTSPAPYKPEGASSGLTNEFSLFPGTFYLENICDKYRRYYAQTPS